MVAKGHRLGDLQMRESRHDGVGMSCGEFDDTRLQTREFRGDCVKLSAEKQPQVCRHLIISRASGVKFFAGIADQLCQARFDIHVYVFTLDSPDKFTAFNLAKHV